MKIAGIILAAGESSRMGRDKALLPLGGQTFLEHLAKVLDGEVAPLVVVLGHHAAEIEQQVRLPSSVRILRNPDYHLGQLSSLHVALRGLAGLGVEGALVCLVDHPAITKQVVGAVVGRFQKSQANILIPTWQGRRGHPVLFSSRVFEELLAAPINQGARAVVRRHANEVEYVEVYEEGILWDVDRPEDYAALQSRWASLNRAKPAPPEGRP
ncbi:MAG: nucleotidyltransferase family protein [Acidobacteria bacterium]|nr:nucleotidyltransferase family protein [Acidobacteriota bacterium]